MYVRSYGLQSVWLLKSLKSPVTEHLWTEEMLKVPKHRLNLHDSSFVIFFITPKKLQFQRFFLSSI